MPKDALPPHVYEFITRNVRSLEQLEILLLVAQEKETTWTVQMVYDVILSTKPTVERWLEEFARLTFLQKEDGDPPTYRFIATDETTVLVRKLAQVYKAKPVRVIEAIFKAEQNSPQSGPDSSRSKRKE